MDPNSINISQHAWDRFQERWYGKQPACWLEELHRLLRSSMPEDLGHGAVLRLMTHGYAEAKYFVAEGWRFVFNEEATNLITCERPYRKGIQKKQKPFNRKRHGG